MRRKLQARVQEEKGFTLIELLVVILIIGILAAIAIAASSPRMISTTSSSTSENPSSSTRARRTEIDRRSAIGFLIGPAQPVLDARIQRPRNGRGRTVGPPSLT